MHSLENKLTVSALTNATAHVILDVAGQHTNYLRLRIDSRDFIRCSPEIGYLNDKSQARYVPRDKTHAGFAKITTLARQLAAANLPKDGISSLVVSFLELEAVEIGGRWCVCTKVVGAIPSENRRVERNHQYRILCADRSGGRLAA